MRNYWEILKACNSEVTESNLSNINDTGIKPIPTCTITLKPLDMVYLYTNMALSSKAIKKIIK